MKNKLNWLLASLFALVAISAQAGDEITTDKNGFHPYKEVEDFAEPNSHWGIFLEGGFTRFDGDGAFGLDKAPFNMDFGLGVTYDFTPLWGLQADLRRTGYGLNVFNDNIEEVNGKYIGHMYNLGADLTFNFINAFFPKREKTLFNMYAHLGGGLAMYTLKGPDDMFFNAGAQNMDLFYDPGKTIGLFTSDKRKINCAPYANLALSVYFNITRTFGLGVKAGYMMFFNDYVDGNAQPRVSSKDASGNWYTEDQKAIKQARINRNNDGLWTCDLQAHWKFISKTDSHTRNYASQDVFDDKIAARKAAKAAQDAADNANKNVRPVQKDTLVISHKDTLVIKQEKTETYENTDLYFVYFANDRYTLDDQAQIDVQQMATRLNRRPNACLELSGFCDNTGSVAHNQKLADQRANMVRRTLIDVYGIDSTRLIDLGYGQLTNVNSSFGPNRRVDMRIVDRSELEKLQENKARIIEERQRKAEEEKAAEEARIAEEKAAREAKAAALKAKNDSIAAAKAAKVAAIKAQKDSIAAALKAQKEAKAAALKAKQDSIAAAAAAAKEAVEAAAKEQEKSLEQQLSEVEMIPYDTTKYIGAEKATANVTLSKLARKYYGNTNCWAYIYKANKDVIKSASYIFPGTKIYMPILTDEEKNITKEEALKLAQTVNN